jgi:hypothetical protein
MNVDALFAGAGAAVQAEIPAMQVTDNPLVPPQPPAFTLFDFTITPHKTMRFASEIDLTFRVMIAHASPESGAQQVRNLASDGPGSVFYALEKPHILNAAAAQTFGGACDDAVVTTMRGYRLYDYGNAKFIGFEIVVHAIGERAS